ncbi:MAG: hypothetical protein RIT28_3424 [Pseudomonadota bacterium]
MSVLIWGLGAALAADWVMLQGTEPSAGGDETPAAVRAWGFVQPLAEGVVGGEPVTGLSSESLVGFNGERASFNRVGSGDATMGFSIRRARFGFRGVIPGTDRRVNWLVGAEVGQNALTRIDPIVLTDASVTVAVAPGLNVRVGQFKLPLGEEALEMNPIAAEFVSVSSVTGQLLNENPSSGGVYTAGVSGFRDVGVQVFDSFVLGQGSLTYALMVSNGGMGGLDADNAKDLSGRLTWAPFVWGEPEAAIRDELSLYAFWLEGQRSVEGVEARRMRRGAGAQLERHGLHARAEVIQGVGAIELGANPPFPGQPVLVSTDGEAIGLNAFVHHQPGPIGAGLRVDSLWRLTDSPTDLRVFHTVTADLQLQMSPKARVMLDYERRWLSAPGASADAQAIAATMGDRVSLQLVAVF